MSVLTYYTRLIKYNSDFSKNKDSIRVKTQSCVICYIMYNVLAYTVENDCSTIINK